MRIVSLVPSLSHLVCDLGLKEYLVACTKFCIDPPDLHRSCALIGGTKDPDLEFIKSLKPTHILGNEEENTAKDLAQCRNIAATYVSLPKSITDVPCMIKDIGYFLKQEEGAEHWSNKIRVAHQILRAQYSEKCGKGLFRPKGFLYFIWNRPWMLASEDTYISRGLGSVGFRNLAPTSSRYPQIEIQEVKDQGVECIFLSSEPWPFKKRDLIDLKKEWGEPMPPVYWIDGKLMSWYGSMTLDLLEELTAFINGEKSSLIKEFSL